MNLIKRFKHLKELHKDLSSLVVFAKTVRDRGYSNEEIERNFKLVSFDDYKGSKKSEILNWLKTLSNGGSTKPRENEISKNLGVSRRNRVKVLSK